MLSHLIRPYAHECTPGMHINNPLPPFPLLAGKDLVLYIDDIGKHCLTLWYRIIYNTFGGNTYNAKDNLPKRTGVYMPLWVSPYFALLLFLL